MRHFELFVTEGENSRFFWRLRDEGVALWPEGIEWRIGGEARKRNWADIEGVHLAAAHIPRSGNTYQCKIRFRSALPLIVQSVTAAGLPDPVREGLYREFVERLHAQLAGPEFSGVRFESGATAGRVLLLKFALGLAGLMFVGLPLVLLFIVPSFQALGILGVGAALVWPLWKTAKANEPGSYSARDLPRELLP